jgi:phosphate starvation-inducible protein PhoH
LPTGIRLNKNLAQNAVGLSKGQLSLLLFPIKEQNRSTNVQGPNSTTSSRKSKSVMGDSVSKAPSTTNSKRKASTRKTFRKSLIDVSPLTPSQLEFFDKYDQDYGLVLSGSAGCGKTFIALFKALEEAKASNYKKTVTIVRSVVPTRDMGFLPGTQKEKEAAYTTPYESLVNSLYGDSNAWETLCGMGVIQFITTSYIRGITIKNSIIIVDECQNCNFHELDSIITRIGSGSRIIFAGDYNQSDFTHKKDKDGFGKFLKILNRLNYFHEIQFDWSDIVRDGVVRDYVMTREIVEKEMDQSGNTRTINSGSTYIKNVDGVEEWSPGNKNSHGV